MQAFKVCYKHSRLIYITLFSLIALCSTAHAQAWGPVAIINRPVVNMCALTFDDGPSALTPQLLDTLKAEGVTATFFLLGEQVARRPEVVERMLVEGHEIASHGYTHADMVTISKNAQRAELQRLNDLLTPMGVTPRFFRPPYGSYNRQVTALVEDMGMDVMMWSTDSRDWQRKPDYSNMPNILERVMTPEEMRGIFLFHDTKKRTVRDIGVIILILRTMGCDRFVTVSEYIDTQEETVMVAALPLEARATAQKHEFLSEEFRNTFSLDAEGVEIAEYGARPPVGINALSARPTAAAPSPQVNTDIAASIVDAEPIGEVIAGGGVSTATTLRQQDKKPVGAMPAGEMPAGEMPVGKVAAGEVSGSNAPRASHMQVPSSVKAHEAAGAGAKQQPEDRQLIADEEAYLDSSLNPATLSPVFPSVSPRAPLVLPRILNTQMFAPVAKRPFDARTFLAVPMFQVPQALTMFSDKQRGNSVTPLEVFPVANNKETRVIQ